MAYHHEGGFRTLSISHNSRGRLGIINSDLGNLYQKPDDQEAFLLMCYHLVGGSLVFCSCANKCSRFREVFSSPIRSILDKTCTKGRS